MREGWVIEKLSEVVSFERGLTYSKGDEVAKSSIGVLRSNNVDLTTQSLNLDDIKYLREDFEVPDKKKVKKSSLLMCISNGSKDHLGKVALIDRDLDYAFGGFMGLLTPEEGKVFPKYLYYALSSSSFKDYIHGLADGANINNLKYKDLAAFNLLLPPIAEQRRIVDLLDKEFAKIDTLKANAEKSLQAAKDLFQATTDTLLNNEHWSVFFLADIAIIKGGKRVPKGDKLEKGPTEHRYIRVADFTDYGTVEPETVLYISDEVYNVIKAYTISTKDVYISIAGTIGKSGIVPQTLDGANLTENACKLVLAHGYYNRFIFYTTKTSSFKKQVELLTMQATQPKLALSRLAMIKIRVPSSFPEQEHIVKRLDGIADSIAILQKNYQKTLALCDELKKALLRKAFNGEL